MANAKFFLFLISSIIALSANTAKADESDVQGILVTAKMTGACGMIDSLITFQEATQMPGGDEFLVRFLATETARLGLTAEQFVMQCTKATEFYNSIMKATEN